MKQMSFQTQNYALLTFHSIMLVFPMEMTVKFVASSNIRDISVVQKIQLLAALGAAGSCVLLLLAFFFFSTHRFTLRIQNANIMAIFWKMSRTENPSIFYKWQKG